MKRLLQTLKTLAGSAMLLLLAGTCFNSAQANNIRIIGLPVVDSQNTAKKTVRIRFDLAWDNSWYTSKPNNHDAAWIYVKCWDGESWNHVYLEDTGYYAGSTKPVEAVNKGTLYSVTDREGKKTDMKMVLKPGYSMAWKKWHLDPTEPAQRCVVGFFLHRQTFGAGHVVIPGVKFSWNYGAQGFVDEDDLVVKVFAVEMVYVPKEAYYLGGRGTESYQVGSFTTSDGTVLKPMVVTSEAAITVNNSGATNTLWALNGAMEAGTIPDSFPKGYQAFYIMKYELTQEAWCEFLNSLNQGQQQGRVNGNLTTLPVNSYAWGGSLAPYRNFVKIKQAAPTVIFGCDANLNNVYNQTDKVDYDGRELVRNIDGQDLAMNFVSWNDLLAYAEFAGLRPMTELEYEKACRGSREPVNDEYAWGSVTAVFFGKSNSSGGGADATYVTRYGVADVNTGTEHVGAAYNVGYARGWTWGGVTNNGVWWKSGWRVYTRTHNSYPAVLRVGVFADSTSTRAEAGATYWGVMNMSDNVCEMCVSAVDSSGRLFRGWHGCGQLDGNGAAISVRNWHINGLPQHYILRGMLFDYYTSTNTYGCSNSWWSNCPGVCGESSNNWTHDSYVRYSVDEMWCRGGNMNHYRFYAGMVSSRHMWNHTCAVDYRSIGTVNVNNAPMRGIRCVRTDNAAK